MGSNPMSIKNVCVVLFQYPVRRGLTDPGVSVTRALVVYLVPTSVIRPLFVAVGTYEELCQIFIEQVPTYSLEMKKYLIQRKS